MATLSGYVSDLGMAFGTLAGNGLQLILTIDEPTTSGGRLVLTEKQYASPDSTGYFSFTVIPNTDYQPLQPYKLSARWLNSEGGYAYYDFIGWDVWVSDPGSTISETAPPNIFDTWIGESDNPEYRFWYQPSTTFLYA